MRPEDELACLLRPAGAGVYLVSTGREEQLALQRALYGVRTDAEVRAHFLKRLERLSTARGVLLGIPSDSGGGVRRGANLGPQAIRRRLLDDGIDLAARGVLDIGDVFVVPQLLHDEMLSSSQIEVSRAALYPTVEDEERRRLPVSPLSIADRVWELVQSINPGVVPFTLGGDHSTALPAFRALHRKRSELALVQADAHTDLMETRLGIKFCFATWSWHANELLGRGGRLVQVGIRASSRDRAHWESTLGVRQLWANEVRAHPSRALDDILGHLKRLGVRGVYFSNDIDGTDSAWADATGTPEPGGLEPDWVVELIRRLGREVGMWGGDVMEVAPSITPTLESADRTVGVAVRYLLETIDAALGSGRELWQNTSRPCGGSSFSSS
jgi:arginase family enzyme